MRVWVCVGVCGCGCVRAHMSGGVATPRTHPLATPLLDPATSVSAQITTRPLSVPATNIRFLRTLACSPPGSLLSRSEKSWTTPPFPPPPLVRDCGEPAGDCPLRVGDAWTNGTNYASNIQRSIRGIRLFV